MLPCSSTRTPCRQFHGAAKRRPGCADVLPAEGLEVEKRGRPVASSAASALEGSQKQLANQPRFFRNNRPRIDIKLPARVSTALLLQFSLFCPSWSRLARVRPIRTGCLPSPGKKRVPQGGVGRARPLVLPLGDAYQLPALNFAGGPFKPFLYCKCMVNRVIVHRSLHSRAIKLLAFGKSLCPKDIRHGTRCHV